MGNYVMIPRFPGEKDITAENILAYGVIGNDASWYSEGKQRSNTTYYVLPHDTLYCIKGGTCYEYPGGDRDELIVLVCNKSCSVTVYAVEDRHYQGNEGYYVLTHNYNISNFDSETGLYYSIVFREPASYVNILQPIPYDSLRELLDACNDGIWNEAVAQSIPVEYTIGGGYTHNFLQYHSIVKLRMNHLLTREEVA